MKRQAKQTREKMTVGIKNIYIFKRLSFAVVTAGRFATNKLPLVTRRHCRFSNRARVFHR